MTQNAQESREQLEYAMHLFRKYRFDQAADAFTRSIEVNPLNAEAWHGRAVANINRTFLNVDRTNQSVLKDGLRDLKRALSLQPEPGLRARVLTSQAIARMKLADLTHFGPLARRRYRKALREVELTSNKK